MSLAPDRRREMTSEERQREAAALIRALDKMDPSIRPGPPSRTTRKGEGAVIIEVEELIGQVKALPPEEKIRLFRALGMQRIDDSHDVDCPTRNTSSPCNCVPPEPTWTQPNDVTVHLKETWEDRRALAEKRDELRRKWA